MRSHRVATFTVLALLLVSPLTAPTAEAQEEPLVVDPRGDATDARPSDGTRSFQGRCQWDYGIPPEVCRAPDDAAQGSTAGAPASPGRDLVGVRMHDTPTTLEVIIEVARIDAGLMDALPRDNMMAWWEVCWTDQDALECAYLEAARFANRISINARMYYFTEECGYGGFCWWPITGGFEAGDPGRIWLSIPRPLLVSGSQGTELTDITATIMTVNRPTPNMAVAIQTAVRPGGLYLSGLSTENDNASSGRPYRIATAGTSTFEQLVADRAIDEDGDAENPASVPNINILSVGIDETPSRITIAVEMARVGETGPDHSMWSGISLARTQAIYATYSMVGNGISSSATRCGDLNCTYSVEVPVRVDRAVGEPGWINFTYDRLDLGSPPAGRRVGATFAASLGHEGTTLSPAPVVEGRTETTANSDSTVVGAPYVLKLNSAQPAREGLLAADHALIITDNASDVEAPPGLDGTAGQYDLILAAAQGISPTMTRFTIGVRDLERIQVPAGWRSLVYSISVQTDRGSYLIGYHRTANGGQFFCAPDTLVNSATSSDPADGAWTVIDGVLSLSRGGTGPTGGGAGGPSTLNIYAPHSCFGEETPGPIESREFIATIHLVPESPIASVAIQNIWRTDEARAQDGAVATLGMPVPLPASPAWYAEPFGVGNFWDITGIVLAILISVIGVLAVWRRRGALRRYIARIDAAGTLSDVRKREAELVDIRTALKEDLLRGRVSDTHYLVIEQRLAERLSKARLIDVAEAFGELPYRLMEKLTEALADGQMSRAESERFLVLLEGSGLTDDARGAIRRKLDAWVSEDAAPA